MINISRKRSREDDSSDMPLSKRINNLHLDNGSQGLNNNRNAIQEDVVMNQVHRVSHHPGQAHPAGSHQNNVASNGHPQHQQQHNHHNHHQHHHQESHVANGDSAGYDPELSQSDNPHYYHKNKLLYELHFMRSRKCHPGTD